MANDPGWGNRNNNGGPPDLDEVLRQFSRKLSSLFGGSGKSDNQSPDNDNRSLAVLPVIGLIVVIWFATGFYIVDQGSRGVVQRFGK
ncbi:MAG TPA: protease modulator HflK N-terminal domain-containing protein, partial [Methylophilaceae bacterium]|nr:protease modulator HflK N-terminal domain-containing protein [Methylophilaceae bacterium]